MQKFRNVAQLVKAIERGDIPSNVVSPGAAAAALGVTRQAVHALLKRGSLTSWGAEGVILVDGRELNERVKKKRGIPEGQGELNVTA